VSSSWKLGTALLLSANLQGCGAESQSQQENAENTDSVEQSSHAVCSNSNIGSWWAQFGGEVDMQPASTHFCWLTKVSGAFEDGLNGASITKTTYGWYRLWTTSDSLGEAHCVPLSCFRGDGINDVTWVSDSIYATAFGYSGCPHQDTNAWWGDAATVLIRHAAGNTEGGAEYSNIIQSGNAFAPSVVQANDCQTSDGVGVQAIARSLFVGTPSGGKLAHFTGAPFWVQGNFTLNLNVFTDEAFCYLTRAHGKFRGGGESVRLFREASGSRFKWVAQATQGGAGSAIRGEGRCYWYHQWDL
jgi:hypothetical protein